MISDITQWVLAAIRSHGAWSVFIGVLIEQIIIPIPSPVLIMGAGAILVSAAATWPEALSIIALQIVLPGSIASLLGALGVYAIGRWGGQAFVERFQGFLGFSWADVETMGAHFSKRGEALSLFLLRAAPIVPLSLISVVSGVLEIPLRLFLVWSFLGTLPRCLLLGILGWQMGSDAIALAKGVDRYETLFSIVILGGVIGAILYLRRRVRKGLAARSGRGAGGA